MASTSPGADLSLIEWIEAQAGKAERGRIATHRFGTFTWTAPRDPTPHTDDMHQMIEDIRNARL